MFKAFTDDELRALEAAHDEIRVVRGAAPPPRRWAAEDKPEPPWEAVFRKPMTGESDSFEGAAHNDKAKPGALRNFAKAVVVGVSLAGKTATCVDRKDLVSLRATRDAWDALRAQYPGAHMAAQDDLMGLAGMARDEEGKG